MCTPALRAYGVLQGSKFRRDIIRAPGFHPHRRAEKVSDREDA